MKVMKDFTLLIRVQKESFKSNLILGFSSPLIIALTHQRVIKTINRSTSVTAQANVSTSTDNISRPSIYVQEVINITRVVTDGDYCHCDEHHPCCHCHEPSTCAPQT